MLKNSNAKIFTNNIWFGLLIIYVITGYFAQDVLLPSTIGSVALYVFFAYSIFAILTSGHIKLSIMIRWEVICLLLSLVAMLYSPEFSIFGGTYYSLLVNFILVFILTQMPWTEKRFDLVMKAFTYSTALLIIVLALTGNLEDGSDSGRLGQEAFGNANILSNMLMVSAVYAIWSIIYSTGKLSKILALIACVIIYIGMFLSGGRKSVVAPIIFLFFLLLNKKNKNGSSNLLKTTVIFGFLAVGMYFIIMKVPFIYESVGHRFEELFALFDGSGKADNSSVLRAQMIEGGLKKWLESPIWGYGFDSFKYYNKASLTGHFYYSHNNLVELLYNQGLIGFVAYYSFYAYLLAEALKIKEKSINKGFAIAAVIMLLISEIGAITYSTTPTQFMLFFALNRLDAGKSIKQF